MSTQAPVLPSPPKALPIAPTEDAWRAMSLDQRARFLDEVLEAQAEQAEAKAEQAEAQLEQTAARAEQAEAKAEQAEAQLEQTAARAEQAEARAEQVAARAEQAVAGLRAGILAALATRGIAVADALRAHVQTCEDPAQLQGWLLRALTATTAEEVFSAAPAR